MTEEVVIPSKEELLATLDGENGAEEQAADVDLTSGGGEEYSEVELQAIEHGWNPEGVEGKRNLSAEEFMDRQPLYDEMRNLKKQARKLEEGMEAMKQMQKGIREREREKTIKELQQKKLEALEDGNYNAVIEIDDQIAEEKVNKPEEVNNHQFEEWVDNNEWYNQDQELRTYADTLGSGYFATNPNAEPKEVFAYVENEVKARYPDKFGNPRRKAPTPVEGATRGRSKAQTKDGSKHKASELSEQDRQIMRTILRTGKMSEAEYLKEYFGE